MEGHVWFRRSQPAQTTILLGRVKVEKRNRAAQGLHGAAREARLQRAATCPPSPLRITRVVTRCRSSPRPRWPAPPPGRPSPSARGRRGRRAPPHRAGSPLTREPSRRRSSCSSPRSSHRPLRRSRTAPTRPATRASRRTSRAPARSASLKKGIFQRRPASSLRSRHGPLHRQQRCRLPSRLSGGRSLQPRRLCSQRRLDLRRRSLQHLARLRLQHARVRAPRRLSRRRPQPPPPRLRRRRRPGTTLRSSSSRQRGEAPLRRRAPQRRHSKQSSRGWLLAGREATTPRDTAPRRPRCTSRRPPAE